MKYLLKILVVLGIIIAVPCSSFFLTHTPIEITQYSFDPFIDKYGWIIASISLVVFFGTMITYLIVGFMINKIEIKERSFKKQ